MNKIGNRIHAHLAYCLAVALLLLAGVAFERWNNAIPPEPSHQQAERVDDESGFGARSGKWPAVRAQFVKQNPKCAACGSADQLNVHHVQPYWSHPQLELEPQNLITLCRWHHWTVGHDPDGPKGPQKPDWQKSNAMVRRDAATILKTFKR